MRSTWARRGAQAFAAALGATALLAAPAGAHGTDADHGHGAHGKGHGHGRPARTVDVQLLGINDFHGNLEPPTGSSGRIGGIDAGGAAYLAQDIREREATNPNTLVVSAGDLIGASPLLSALFHDEPTIEAFNEIGLDLDAVGNHEFDEGAAELRRMQDGGCNAKDGCQSGHIFQGADFRFLAANVVEEKTGQTLFPPYAIRRFGHVKVGFIGLTLKGTPAIVSAAGVQGLQFLDEVQTINHYADELRREHGVRAIVVLLHQGGQQNPTTSDVNACNNPSGEVFDIVRRTTPQVDLFMTGHTHQAYNCLIDGRPVTSASSFGRLLTDVDLTIDRRTKDVVPGGVKANNVVVTRDTQAWDVQALIQRYKDLAAPLANRVVGYLAGPATKAPDPDGSGENTAGNLIADSQLAATSAPDKGGAVAAFMNPGGVRADFPGGRLTYEQIFTVQPFGNLVSTETLTGAQLFELLKEQFCNRQATILLPSKSVHYAWSRSVASTAATTPCASAPNPVTSLSIDGVAVQPDQTPYRITVNNFLADGGDAFTVLKGGTNRINGPVDLDALEAYLASTSASAPLPVPDTRRIDVVP